MPKPGRQKPSHDLMRAIINALTLSLVEICREAEDRTRSGATFSRSTVASNLRNSARAAEAAAANPMHGRTAATILRNIAAHLDSGNPPVAPVPFE